MNQLNISLLLYLRIFMLLAMLAVVAYIAACLFLLFRQNRFIFFPSKFIETRPDSFHLDYQEVWLPVKTGVNQSERMYCWWLPAPKTRLGVLLYLHGNGINMGANIAYARQFLQLGFSVLTIDYRGYGLSEGGFPTESRVYEDAAAAWDYLVRERKVEPHQIFIYGHSLGGAIAIDLAVRHPDAAGLIVESSFTSIRQMVDRRGQFWMFPVDLLLTQRFDSIDKVRSLSVPVLFIHGTADTVVPSVMSQQLYAATPAFKQLLLVPGAGHNNVMEVAGSQYLQTVQNFVRQVRTAQKALS
jgi:pimeloyl-ACP methyl ester carboxylesterase